MTRNRSIDAYRGLAIIGMVFFTLTLKLSSDLPDLLRHNVRGSLHLGDLVLPMFLFVSGLSLAYYLHKRENDEPETLLRDVIGRFGLLALIGILLSPFSAGGLLEMDEVMLIALLFLACTALSGLDWKVIMGIVVFINLSYWAVMAPGWAGLDWTDAFSGHYLGGYAAAPFYLPVMLVGFIMGREIIARGTWSKNNRMIIILVSLLFFLSWVFVPVDKLAVSPSFMMLSIMFCFAVFLLMDKMVRAMHGFEELEYLGRKPLRYWVMMYMGCLIPIMLYAEHSGLNFPLDFHWPLGIMLSVCVILLLWLMSKGIDLLREE